MQTLVVRDLRAKKYGFAMQLNESTDVTNCNQLLVNVRFTENDVVKIKVLLTNKEVSSTTKGKCIIVELFQEK